MPTKNEVIKDRILETAYEKFTDKGVRRVTMDDIAYELSISKKTLYKHYGGKKDIVRAILTKYYEPKVDNIRAALTCNDDIPAALAKGFKAILSVVESGVPLFMADVKDDYPDLYELFEAKRRGTVSRVVEFLKQGVEKGVVRDSVDPEITAGIMMTVFTQYMAPDNLRKEGLSVRQCLTTWFTILTGGVFKEPPDFDI